MKDTAENAAELASAFFGSGFTATHYVVGILPGEWLVVDMEKEQAAVVFTGNEEVLDGYDYDSVILNYGGKLSRY